MIRKKTGRHEGILKRLEWMFKVRDCRHICLFCKYYEQCRGDGILRIPGKEGKEHEHEVRKKK